MQFLEADSLCPGQAARLRGKLGFAVVAAFGRFGRAQMSAIKRRHICAPFKRFQADEGPACAVGLVAAAAVLLAAPEYPTPSCQVPYSLFTWRRTRSLSVSHTPWPFILVFVANLA